MAEPPGDQQDVVEFLKAALPAPGTIRYRTEVDGKLDAKELAKHTELLQGLRNFRSYFTQTGLSEIIRKVAGDKEDEWRLAGEQKSFGQQLCEESRTGQSA